MLSWTQNLQLYLDNNLNVLLCGQGGTGKTTVVKELFDKNFGEDWLYIAGATVDPFTDLLGVPRPVLDQDTGKEVLDFVKPRKLQLNKVKAIFCDEYNRSPKKVMNALMEIIQFKSLGNEPVPNLRMVWCAINPEDEDYNIEEKLDRSQKDRFHIHIDVPYLLDKDFFVKEFGKDMFEGMEEWWNNLPNEIRKEVSPRRLEYTARVFQLGGNLREVLPASTNISSLITNLNNGTMASQLEKLLNDDEKTIKEKLKDINVLTAVKNKLNKPEFIKKFTHLLPEELITEQAPSNLEMCTHIKKHSNKFDTTLIETLSKMGCFTQSDFGVLFSSLNKDFPNGAYSANKRNKLKKLLKTLPDVSKSTIKPSDIENLQKLINIMDGYISVSQSYTPTRDNEELNFFDKFNKIKILNEKQKLGLKFSSNYRSLSYQIEQWIVRQEMEKKRKEQQTMTTNPILRFSSIYEGI